jgi:hypothetical protein
VSPGRGEGAACAAGRAIKIFPPLLSARGYTASSHARPSQSGVGQGYTRVRAEPGGGDDGSIHRGAGVNASGGRRARAKRPREGGGMARERASRTLGPARAISPALFPSSPREPARVLSAAFASGGGRSQKPRPRGLRREVFELWRGAAKGDPVSILIGTLIGARSHFGLAFFVSFDFPDGFARRVGFARSCHGRLLPPSAFFSFPSVASRAFASRARTARDARRLTRTRRRHIARERHARASPARETSRRTRSRRSSATLRTAPRQLSEIPTVPGRRPPACRRRRARASGPSPPPP